MEKMSILTVLLPFSRRIPAKPTVWSARFWAKFSLLFAAVGHWSAKLVCLLVLVILLLF